MDIQGWNPYVRFARKKDTTLLQGLLQAVDHRILYFHSGSGHIEADGVLYPISPGCLIYTPAGTSYRYLFDKDIPVYSGFNFDFYQAHADLKAPIPPVSCGNFLETDILEKQYYQSALIPLNCIYLQNAFQFEMVFLETAQEYENHNLFYDIRCSTLLKDIFTLLIRISTTQNQGINYRKADTILRYIHSHVQEKLTNHEIAKQFGYHENYISSLILKYTGLTLHQYVLNYKMHTAVGLLQSSTLSVSEVAEKVGIPDIKHFSKCFKKIMGRSPSIYKVK